MSVFQDTSAPEADPGCGDKRRLVKTKTPGVFKRVDGKGRTIGYACIFRSAGRQRKRHARTYEEARRIKRESEADRDRGELQERSAITLRRYLDEWVERYRGQGRRGFRENTRDEYRRLSRAYAHPYFPARLKLVDVSTYTLARFVDWLADEQAQGKRLGDRTIANATMPLRAALATAKREGLIRHNPAQGLSLPPREQLIGDETKVFTPGQLATVIGMAPRAPQAALGATGGDRPTNQRGDRPAAPPRPVGRSRARGLRPPRDRQRPHRAAEDQTRPPRGTPPARPRRKAPRPPSRRARSGLHRDLFPSDAGAPLDPSNLRPRVLKPLVKQAGASWAGFHTFRHTFASLHLSRGTNLLQLSRALGHHSPAFTLTRYTHLLPGDEAPALELNDACSAVCTQ